MIKDLKQKIKMWCDIAEKMHLEYTKKLSKYLYKKELKHKNESNTS